MKIKKEDLIMLEDEGLMIYDIGYRGGTYGLKIEDFMSQFIPEDIDQEFIISMLPDKIGAYCNYLGGGLRGAICRSDYNKKLPERLAKIVDEFTELCHERYIELEGDLNDEGTEDEPNWDAMGTNSCRNAGIVSNY